VTQWPQDSRLRESSPDFADLDMAFAAASPSLTEVLERVLEERPRDFVVNEARPDA
jgi:hypothetical protein